MNKQMNKKATKKVKKPYETDELKADEKVKTNAGFNEALKKGFFTKPEKRASKK